MICDQLLGRRAAFYGTLSLALSPMHVYYAQEARMYALVVCVVGLTYLALIAMNTVVSWLWSATYALAATTALYLDYSAAFALAPQLLLIGYLIDRHRRAAFPLLICVTLGALVYAPWVPQLVDSVQAANEVERREAYLGTDSTRVPDTLLALVGLGGDGSYVQSTRNLLWDAAPALQPIYLVTILGVCALGIRALLSRQLAAMVVASALGTVAVAIWVSQISPAFAERTVLSAVIGWALIVAACGSAGIATQRDRLASSLAIVAIGISSFGAWIVDTSATKQRWEDAVDDISRTEEFGFPVVTYSYGHVADTFIDLYGSGDLDRVNLISIRGGDLEDVLSNGLLPDRGMTLAEAQAGALGDALELQGSMPQFIWFLYYVRPGTNELIDTIQNLGYERVRYGEYWSPRYRVYLDLFALSNVSSGDLIVVNGSFQNRGEGWSLPNNAAALSSEGESTNLILSGDGVTPQRATTSLPGGNSLYDLTLEVRTELDPKVVEISLGCADGTGKTSIVTKMNSRDEVWANTYRWETVRLAAVCPEETTTVQILLGVAGLGTVEFRNVELLAVRPGFVTSLDD
jgi:hypothetical protein